MSKVKTAWFCSNCGAKAFKWIGCCPACGEWNTYQEEVVQRTTDLPSKQRQSASAPIAVQHIENAGNIRIATGSIELDRVLGGGLVAGSLILVGGEPGIGKSTLMLQIALRCKGLRILYISGEESAEQIKMRADRVGIDNENCYILNETSVETILNHLDTFEPQIVIVDSIQTLNTSAIDSSSGSISQIRECASMLQQWCKTDNVPLFLIGHITKDGSIAGPQLLEHTVDAVLYFEGDRNYGYRILRSMKNRFGSTNELGIFEMQHNGLREVHNPSEILISHRDEPISGVAITSVMEGMRPLLIEIQALVGTAAYGTPQRSATGFDVRRMNMLLAVLEKRCGFRINTKDVFLNVAGGLRVDDPVADLAVVCAILSSSVDIPLRQKDCFAGEVGLSGEIRPVNRIEIRVAEAEKLGFDRIFVAKHGVKNLSKHSGIEVVPVVKVDEIARKLFK
jgi:DNA repair protein RadA/Sms